MLLKYCGFQMKVLLINELKWSFIKQKTKDKSIQGLFRDGCSPGFSSENIMLFERN